MTKKQTFTKEVLENKTYVELKAIAKEIGARYVGYKKDGVIENILSTQGPAKKEGEVNIDHIDVRIPLESFGFEIGEQVILKDLTGPMAYMNGRKAVIVGRRYKDLVQVQLLHKKMGFPQGTIQRVSYTKLEKVKTSQSEAV